MFYKLMTLNYVIYVNLYTGAASYLDRLNYRRTKSDSSFEVEPSANLPYAKIAILQCHIHPYIPYDVFLDGPT